MNVNRRESNFECLRIVAMLMILNLHSFVGQGSLKMSDINGFVFFDYLRESFSICAVNCFVLISGYWGIIWKRKSLLNLIFQVYFYVIGFFFILVFLGYTDFSIGKMLSRLNCLLVSYWFISAYLVLYLLSPLLNNFTGSKNMHRFIVVYFLVQTYFSLIGPKYFNDCLNFVGLYLIGRFIKIYPQSKILKISKEYDLILYICLSILICIVALAQKILTDDGNPAFSLFCGVYSNPLVVLQSLFLFLFFLKVSIKNNFINWCGASALSVYLIHLSPDLKYYYLNFCRNLYTYNGLYHYLILLFFIPIVFFVCILIDKFRILLWNHFYISIESKFKFK